MFSFGQPGSRQFGGVGAMVDPGSLRISIEPADRFAAVGPLSQRTTKAVGRIAGYLALAELPACRVEVARAPGEHVGLGTGTQLALSLAAGLNAFFGGEPLEPTRLAALTDRGARSAIGTYGFVQGGLLVDRGKLDSEALSPLEARVELPAAWRFALVGSCDRRGLSGDEEQQAFRELPPVAPETTARLLAEVSAELLPAVADADFARFSESLYRFGREAGLCFAARQGGAFAGPQVTELVGVIRSLGVRGAGQSSWGPTVFALLENESEARRLQEDIAGHTRGRATVVVVQPSNSGAIVTRRDA